MMFDLLAPLSIRTVVCLNALSVVTTATSDVRHAGFSIEAVKIAPSRTPDQVDLVRRGDDEFSVGVDSQWFLPVELGTPPQSFLMTPDTGAPGLAVKSVFLPSNETDSSPAYDPSKSSTASELNGYKYSNCYGSGHCGTGIVYNDTVTVGNLSVQMAFEVSTGNNGVDNGNSLNSGDFGLNFAQGGMSTSPKNIPTWLQTVVPLFTNRVFTIDFDETSSTGTFDFGYINASKYHGEIGYTPVTGNYQWAITFSGFQVGTNGSFNSTQSWNAIVDSGTAKTGLPKFVVDGYFRNIPAATYNAGSGTYKFSCSTVLPDFVFGVAGDATYRGVIPLQGNPVGNGMCTTKLSVGTGTVIFGQNFIESQFMVFDFGNGRVGFANKGTSASAASSTATQSGTRSTASATSSGHSGQSSRAARIGSVCEWWLQFFVSVMLAMMIPCVIG